jgi:Cof subfamily protein (haloacid dehalogenase superfamily)
MLKCVVSDVDGTLLKYGNQQLSDRLVRQIQELSAFGVRFVVASGRPYSNLQRLFSPVREQISYVVENGAMCFHNGRLIHKDVIPKPLANRLLSDILSKPGCEILLSTPRVNILQPKTREYEEHVRTVAHYDVEITEDITAVQEDIIKIAVCEFGGIGKWESYFKQAYQDKLAVVTSGNIWMDFMTKQTNKGAALQKLLRQLQISPQDVIAFGDQFNDTEMLQLAGCGYAMENAAPGVEAYADKICRSVEDVLEIQLQKLRNGK